MKTILITRPRGDEGELAEALQERGFAVIHEPLTEIFLMHTARPAIEQALMGDPHAVIVTSRHGVYGLAALTQLRDMQLLCIGDTTAHAAEDCGFTRVASAGGDGQKLVEHIAAAYDPGSQFLYASASHIRTDIVNLLAACDMQVERVVVYEAAASQQLSDIVVEHLRRGHIDAVSFLSHRAAQIFTTLVTGAGVGGTVESMHACCLSEGVAEPLKPFPWQGIHIAGEPTLASLVECVDNALK